jgi:hypothetical protein
MGSSGSGRESEASDIFLQKTELRDIHFDSRQIEPRLRRRGGRKERNERSEPCETFCTQLETRVDFFYFFARNPLKSPDSDE